MGLPEDKRDQRHEHLSNRRDEQCDRHSGRPPPRDGGPNEADEDHTEIQDIGAADVHGEDPITQVRTTAVMTARPTASRYALFLMVAATTSYVMVAAKTKAPATTNPCQSQFQPST